MKTYIFMRFGLTSLAFLLVTFLFSSCYTVLKQSGEYYSEFGQETSDKFKETNIDSTSSDSLETDEEIAETDQSDNTGTVVINRYYYDSPWWSAAYGYGYPGPYWAAGIGYTWYLGYYPYDYYYWGGCYYPSYPGYHYYYPDPWYYPGSSNPTYSFRRNYGLRHDALNSTGLNGIQTITSSTVISQRKYNTGTTARANSTTSSQNTKTVKATKKNRRRFTTKSSSTASRVVEKKATSTGGKSGQRKYKEVDIPKNNNKSFQQGFENAKNHFTQSNNQSSRGSNTRAFSSGGNSSRSSGSRSSSPNVGNRTYNSRK